MKDSSVNKSNKDHLDKHLKGLRDLEYIPKGHVDFFESITKAHYEAKDRIREDTIYPSLGKEKAQEMLSKGFPLMNFDGMKVKVEPLRTHFKEICNILIGCEEPEGAEVETFSKSEEYKKLDLQEFISKTLSRVPDYLNQFSEKTGVNENTLTFMAISLARPLFELAAAEMKDNLNGYSWWKNYCPACGSEPFMAKIRKGDNMRILACSLCGTQWNFDRVKCPFCDEHDPSGKSLKHFYYHKESPHRLNVCDKCKRYIKTVDERKKELGEIDLTIEDMATLYLDTLAREKGYVTGETFGKTRGKEDSSQQPNLGKEEGGEESV